MNAYLVSHNGMGDNLYMIGALRYLINFYDKIYFLCKKKYYDNVVLFFGDPNIICVPFDDNNENAAIKYILDEKQHMNDIFVCGDCHKQYVKSKITNTKLITTLNQLNQNHAHDEKYTIEFDTLTRETYYFIEGFYKDINLNLTHFYDYFHLPITNEAMTLYNGVKDYYIVFIQLKSSNGETLNISNLVKTYLHNDAVILICNDKNLYDVPNKTSEVERKFNLCNDFVCNKLVHYTTVIQNSNEIYIIDSCFVGIVLQYLKTNKLKANKVRIITRDVASNVIL